MRSHGRWRLLCGALVVGGSVSLCLLNCSSGDSPGNGGGGGGGVGGGPKGGGGTAEGGGGRGGSGGATDAGPDGPATGLDPVANDPFEDAYPKFANYQSVNPVADMLKFQLNAWGGEAARVEQFNQVYAANPKIVNLIIPVDETRSIPNVGFYSYSATYGQYYDEPGFDDALVGGTTRGWAAADKLKDWDTAYVLDLRSSGTKLGAGATTAEWSAAVKVHYAFRDGLGAGTPSIAGIWGDNDFSHADLCGYVAPEVCGSGSTSPRDFDTGAARMHKRVRALLDDASGPGQGRRFVQGGNGAANLQAFGDLGEEPHGETFADASMTEHAQTSGGHLYQLDGMESDGFDVVVQRIQKWMDLKSFDGRQRYMILNVDGSGYNRPLTVEEQRISLAAAALSGAHLWMIQPPAATCSAGDTSDCVNWAYTVIPGGDDALPEMGEGKGGFASGWLGAPTGKGEKLEHGRWRRKFTHGRVYANIQTEPWAIDGHTVGASDALFVRAP